jgi:hypothetical protein
MIGNWHDICSCSGIDSGTRRQMNEQTLHQENEAFRGTRGVSENNCGRGFQPAFRDSETGRVEVSRQQNGEPATIHIISWLPPEWGASVGEDGAILALKPGIDCGFVHDGAFYTREEAAEE